MKTWRGISIPIGSLLEIEKIRRAGLETYVAWEQGHFLAPSSLSFFPFKH